MAKIIKMPVLGIAIANISINEWFVKVGDQVSHGQPLLEVQTDKITMEVPSEESGVLLKTFYEKEAQLTDGVPIAIIGEAGEDITSLISEVQAELQGLDVPQPEPEATLETETDPIPEPEPSPVKASGKPLATPLVKRIAREHGVDLSRVIPTGPGGRITKKDVLAFTEPAKPVEKPTLQPTSIAEDELIEVIPLTGTRKVIADNMLASVQSTPHYTIDAEVDCTRLVILRNKLKDDFKEIHGVDLTFVPFVVKAMALAVNDVPLVNATVRGDEILVQKVAHVGVAVAKDDLLYVPVVRSPISKTLLEVAREVTEVATLVRDDKLSLDQLVGSTITLTNMGIVDLGSDGGTSVINPPEVAVICMGRVRDRVVPKDGEVAIQPSMRLLFTYDHRVVMGIPGAKFAEKMKYYLEHPELLIAT
jgi:pyruvate/2-oxoglutarate dehydrogenase complex dihydrolipoamide acyltransferase (E2) component